MERPRSQSEISHFFLDLVRAQQDGPPGGFLWSQVRGLGQNEIDAVGPLGMRAIYHLGRLREPGRSTEEKLFVDALVRHVPSYMGPLTVQDRKSLS